MFSLKDNLPLSKEIAGQKLFDKELAELLPCVRRV